MKRYFIFFTVTLIFVLTKISIPQIKVITDSDLQIKKTYENCIKNDVKEVTGTRFDIEEGKVSDESEKINKINVDLSKSEITEITFYPNYSKTVATFNEKKNVKDVSIYYANNTLMSRVITNYEFDNVNIKNKIYYFGNSMTFKTEYTYSSSSAVRLDYVDSAGKTNGHSKLFYDNANRLIEEDKYDEIGTLEIVYLYFYDKSGNCIEENISYPQANFISKIYYKYDKRGNVAEKTVFSLSDKMTSRNEYTYNDEGLLLEDVSYSIDGKVVSKSTYKYDDKGNKTEWRYTDFTDEIDYLYRYEYSY